MKVIVFDTETTHLLSNETKDICRIAQLSWILYDTKDKTIEENDFILNTHCEIENSHIHGITTEKSEKGYEFSEIIGIFLEDIEKAQLMVGHNLKYDLNAIEAELMRLKRLNDVEYLFSKKVFDTMKVACKKLKLKKYPKLVDLYKHFFGEEFDNAHNALEDVRATFKCFCILNDI